ncbi:MAG: hypothetical protein IJM55_06140, partial [Ruminococcus sp.]|nr:hypothetical protein [Ruminococcus sp.]
MFRIKLEIFFLTSVKNGVIIIKLSAKETSTKGKRPPGGGEEKVCKKYLTNGAESDIILKLPR